METAERETKEEARREEGQEEEGEKGEKEEKEREVTSELDASVSEGEKISNGEPAVCFIHSPGLLEMADRNPRYTGRVCLHTYTHTHTHTESHHSFFLTTNFHSVP